MLRRAFDRGVYPLRPRQQLRPALRLAPRRTSDAFLADDFRPYRDELIISTKAGWDMWPGPYGNGGGSRKYVACQPRPEPGTDGARLRRHLLPPPLRPRDAGARRRHGGAGHGGPVRAARCTSASRPTRAAKTKEAAEIARDLGTPLLIHQPSYSLLNRWIEEPQDGGPNLLDELETQGMGCIVFTALAQGLLTDRYLDGVPADSRAARDDSTIAGLEDDVLARVRHLNGIAERRGQKLAQLALQWVLRDERVTSAVIGASSVEQLDTNLDALAGPALTDDEIAEIERYAATESDVNLWATATEE